MYGSVPFLSEDGEKEEAKENVGGLKRANNKGKASGFRAVDARMKNFKKRSPQYHKIDVFVY